MADSVNKYGPYLVRFATVVLADVDDFLERNPTWGEISLLKAGELDHRLLARLKDGDNFQIDTLDRLAQTMNRAAAGELDPEKFRNKAKPKENGEHANRTRRSKRVSA